ncbi:major pollen allergen Ole e 6 [Cucumis sativus]|uniref:Major pollen allergen Ole e 6-like n=1 Tax=Cucumis sativus TaxID=3659 RepID=A0A0A0K9T2_CUCSA|nr:major pollen allergen Ole e 6 [Cucumis sativus]KGN46485.1 hypothetical protein Csa_005747 [Cucumis sativus]
MAKKIVAVFFMCIVVMASLQFGNATNEEVKKYEAKYEAKYVSCYENCLRICLARLSGRGYCEVKCDEDCEEKEVAEKLHIQIKH